MNRKLVAALACRVQGSRLYGKPLQALDLETGTRILDQIIANLQSHPVIEAIVLGISEGVENTPFVDVARTWGLQHIWGDPIDVLQRLIACGHAGQATDVFRVTTESPFHELSIVEKVWGRHVEHGNDVTVTEDMPDGTHFEIYRLSTLEQSHAKGGRDERSELCSLYVRRHLEEFRVELVEIPEAWRRLDLRLTVDYPEDLVLCRRVYTALKHKAPCIPLEDIIAFLDARPALKELVAAYVANKPIWGRRREAVHG